MKLMSTRLLLIPAFALGLAGCSDESATTNTDPPAQAEPATAEADYPLEVCVVSGEKLGSMGDPIEVTVQDHTFKLCCASCEDELRENPDKFIKVLEEAKQGSGPAPHGPASHPGGDHSGHDH